MTDLIKVYIFYESGMFWNSANLCLEENTVDECSIQTDFGIYLKCTT